MPAYRYPKNFPRSGGDHRPRSNPVLDPARSISIHVFHFSNQVMQKVNKNNGKSSSWGKGNVEERKELLVQYMCEWVYSTLMSPEECVPISSTRV
jgi:hypothetical protein